MKAISLHKALERASRKHAQDCGKRGLSGHKGSDGSSYTDRIEREASWSGRLGENVFLGRNVATGQDVVIALLLSGVSKGGTLRSNIFGKDIKYIGVGVSRHADHDLIAVINYAADLKSKGADSESDELTSAVRESDIEQHNKRTRRHYSPIKREYTEEPSPIHHVTTNRAQESTYHDYKLTAGIIEKQSPSQRRRSRRHYR